MRALQKNAFFFSKVAGKRPATLLKVSFVFKCIAKIYVISFDVLGFKNSLDQGTSRAASKEISQMI